MLAEFERARYSPANQTDTVAGMAEGDPRITQNSLHNRGHSPKFMLLRQFQRPRCHCLCLFALPDVNAEFCSKTPREDDLVRIGVVRSSHHTGHALASDVAIPQHPRGVTRITKCAYSDSRSSPEAGMIKNLEPLREILFGLGKVTTIIIRHDLEHKRAAEDAG